MNKNQKRTLATLAALAITLAVVNASVFVYYPITVNLSPVAPPVIFDKGSNTGGDDLGNNKIQVVIQSNDPTNTSATITVHPTYRTTYYKDILRIKNQDTRAYHIRIYVEDIFNDDKIISAYLIIGSEQIDLKSGGFQPSDSWITISASGQLSVDLKLVISTSGGSYDSAPSLSDSQATIKLIYSPQNIEPPPTP